ncbi:ABC transporter ATP-binding protein [Azoarcus sp. CIB]|uniref:ABC transporter ATP-binding protein n=1 Tax=Aromatoleum sp. (strain CIB) TaxID=198107 RepID=UPI00067D2276|nr:ABC transporter ATP-binding protein [Azoarcus sp. CIB]
MGRIEVSNLGKAFKQYPTRWSRLLEWVTPGHRPHHTLKWVLKDVSFDLDAGESMGILGVNGAGKSTLLKIITGTTQPTAGSVRVGPGRVAALLELGMGFHPDFTGRQNAFMAGQLQGLTVEQITTLMPEIEQFADIGDYVDQPVRIYSSGMQVRLAFAVATVLRPAILIVDEALAVGDAAFQRKCFRRIEDFREQGTSLLYVSHDVDSVKRICGKALFLNNGEVFAFGSAKNVCDLYEKALFGGRETAKVSEGFPIAPESLVDESLASDCEVAYGDGRALIEAIWLENASGERANVFGSREPIVLKYRVRFAQMASRVAFAFMAKTRDGVALFGMDTSHMPDISARSFAPGDTMIASFKLENAFAPGVFYINCGVRDDSSDVPVFLHRRVDAVIFRIRSDDQTFVKSGLINTAAVFELALA